MHNEGRRNSWFKVLTALANLEPVLIVQGVTKRFHTTCGSKVDSLSAHVSLCELKNITHIIARLPWTRCQLPVLMDHALEGINPIKAKITAIVGEFLESAAYRLPWGW